MGKSKSHRKHKTVKERLAERYGSICSYCGKHLPLAQLTKDHIKPKKRGGASKFENYALACEECNVLKGNRDVWEFIEKDRPHAPIKERLIKMRLKKRKT